MGERLGEALLDLRTDDKAFTRGVGQAERQAQGLGRRLDDTANRAAAMGKALGAAAAASAVALTALVVRAINNADAMSKAAQRTGVKTEALSRLAWAGDLADVSLGTLTGSLARLTNQMGQMAAGQGRDLEAIFDAIGVSATDAEGRLRSADAVLMDLADVFASMEDGAEKTALAIKLFGRSGAELIPLLNAGRKELADMGAEADRLGRTISTEMGRRAEAFNDAMTRVKASFQGIVVQLADQLLPHLEEFAQRLTDPEMVAAAQAMARDIVDAIGSIASALRDLNSLFRSTKEWVDWLAEIAPYGYLGLMRRGHEMLRPERPEAGPRPLADQEFNRRHDGLPQQAGPAPSARPPRTGPSLAEILAAGAAQDRIKAQLDELELLRKEISLVGQSDQARARAIATLQAEQEVRRLGIDAKGKEAQELVANAQALADYAAELEKAAAAHAMLTQQAESIEMLRLELMLIGQSEPVRARAIAALQAEQDIRRMGLETGSLKAQQIREQARLQAELTSAVEKSADAWGTFKSAGERAIDDLVAKLRKGDIPGALEALGDNIGNTLAELAIANPLKNALLGTNLGTIDQLGGILGRLFGGGEDLASAALAQTVGTMSVQAAVVNISGGEGLARMFAPANSNVPGGGAGSGQVTRAPLADVAGAAGRNPLLDLIARAEGTSGPNGYNTSLGYGKFTGGEKNLTGMTLDQIDALQRQMLAHPENTFNSSALGRYQIVGKTMRGLRGEMGLKGDELFDERMQDRMALQLAQRRGPNVDGLRNEWEGLRNVPDTQILDTWREAQKSVAVFASKTSEATLDLGQLGTGLADATGGLGDLASGLTGLLGGGDAGAGGLLAMLAKLFSGFFASGGLIPSGTFGIVGERGPEPVIGTSRGAMVLPNSSLTAIAGRRERGNVVAVQPVIHNYAPVDVSGGEEDDGQGGTRPTLVIEERMAAGITRRGSAVRGSLESTYGLRPRRRRL